MHLAALQLNQQQGCGTPANQCLTSVGNTGMMIAVRALPGLALPVKPYMRDNARAANEMHCELLLHEQFQTQLLRQRFLAFLATPTLLPCADTIS